MSELSHQHAFRLIHQVTLSDTERTQLQAHLHECSACREHALMAGLLAHNLVLEPARTRPSTAWTAEYWRRADRHARSQKIMKPVYAVVGVVALFVLALAGWYIMRPDITNTSLEPAAPEPVVAVVPTVRSTEPPAANPAPSEVPAISAEQTSRMVVDSIPSPSLSGAMFGSDVEEIAVYLPPSYDSSAKRYPVLYIGMGASSYLHRDNLADIARDFPIRFDVALEKGTLQEMIIVLTDIYSGTKDEPKMSRWGSDSPLTGDALGFLAEDVVSYVDATYRTIPEAAARGLLGADWSGNEALMAVITHPGVFGVLYLNQPWLLAPGALADSFATKPAARDWITMMITSMDELPLDEAEAQFTAFLNEEPRARTYTDVSQYFTTMYGWAFAGDPALKPPYFTYLYTDVDTPAPEVVWQQWEAGLGNVPEKVASGADSLKQLNALGIGVAENEHSFTFSIEGTQALLQALDANDIAHDTHPYAGSLEHISTQFPDVILPYFSEHLQFEE